MTFRSQTDDKGALRRLFHIQAASTLLISWMESLY
ncbi:hypothetical protein SH16_02619 [Aeromonas caviae]|jgi:hypothetical protein|uniref:Uncharacterized protein n=1 Tax=Aeromonas caviae TaxID=648 RepID=A0A3G9I8T9_AERCA|nr:hypothetical protein SH16_02619 [Aeromonas caviae]BBG90730.1 hypothetical protein ACGSH8M1_033960 [Aeromonas caviae]BBQ29191.1 hypothetical protein WP2W18E01_07730 [Aeromonas caviae]BBR09177.1 hypothetical protein WP3S18E02_08380 [Aeromonas caviae]BBT22699.1 hypothetical protein WP8S17E03_31240 [Aeromonas caviae]